MAILRLRITGSDDQVNQIRATLYDIDGIEHVEETDDLMPHMDDDDSSSAGLSPSVIAGAFAVAAVSAALALYQSAFVGKLYREVVGQQDDAAVFA